MGLFGAAPKKVEEQQKYFSAVDGIKRLYKSRIRPVEELYKYQAMNSATLTDADFDARPQVLLLGQYSVGKTSFIKYLLERDFPGSHIGPEPTTDRFMAIMHGPTERVTPGNALAVQEDKPFRGLQQFGTSFLQRLECSQCDSEILKSVTFVDSPGVLSGEKQRIGRAYDFVKVVEWFAQKSDLIILLFDAHKLDISDEFKRTIVALKQHDEKIRVVLNKADSVSEQQLMRVYGALMWSLGKVSQTPEVKRVYISSFWEYPLRDGSNVELFEKERDDLLRELRDLPRYAAVRKINELVKRTRYVKVHALLIGHIKSLMPTMWGKQSKQQWIINNMREIFRSVQREHQLPMGDFPNIEHFITCIKDYDFSRFPKVDMALIESMDQVLARDVPAIMNDFPPEREDAAQMARAAASHEPTAASSSAAASSGAPPAGSNPFDPFGTATTSVSTEWIITMSKQAEYRNIFASAGPVDGKLSGASAKEVLVKSRLDPSVLGRIWTLSDIDSDGYLDEEEFCVAMHLCHECLGGQELPSKLPDLLVPPTKRHIDSAC
ncbi:uncharacterized protein MONBRDRAFT_38103 [Monosiga brevicollis MX1]|uniref:Calmodulin n=1 Tax=Monosiga brevicollis TaxID=81824 RepID=A9V5P6_MONBE|nr:uncharacterized protein MONBRDRAFT_38103 [Monosiga brevicollis MX1]EDQ87078.1 predicted protein [Monosiga brevicollis MX1]|eukprot:XP_001748021.1 hypothetical protein [Monosiga brevicollis MX1]